MLLSNNLTFEEFVGMQFNELERLTMLSNSLKNAKTISQEDVVSVESISPNTILGELELRDFSLEQSNYNYNVAMEKIDLKKLGIIGKVLQAIIDFIKRLFKGRKNDKKQADNIKEKMEDVEKKSETLDEEIVKSSDKLDEAAEPEVTLSKQLLLKLRDQLKDLNISEEEARDWTKDRESFITKVYKSTDFRKRIIFNAMHEVFFNILTESNWALLQDDLGSLLALLETEAVNRSDYLLVLAEFGEGVKKSDNRMQFTHGLNPDSIPQYSGDIGKIRQYMKLGENTDNLEVISKFTSYVLDLFSSPSTVPDDLVYGYKTLSMRFTDTLRKGLVSVNTYNDFFTKSGADSLDKLDSVVKDVLHRRNRISPDNHEAWDKAVLLLSDELKLTARLTSTMVIIYERGNLLLSKLENAYKKLDEAITFVQRTTDAIYGEYRAASVGKHIPLKPAFKNNKDQRSLESVISIADSIELRGTVSKSDAVKINDLGLFTNLPSLEQYTVFPSELNYQITVEGLREKAKELFAMIVKKISELLERFVKWFKGSGDKADERLARHEKVYGKASKSNTIVRLLQDQREQFGKIYEVAKQDEKTLNLLRVVLNTRVQPADGNKSANFIDELKGYHSEQLYDYLLSTITRGLYTVAEYQLMAKEESNHIKALKLLVKEAQRRTTIFVQNVENLNTSLKEDSEALYIFDDETENSFMRDIVSALAVPFKPSNIKGINPGVDTDIDEAIGMQKSHAISLVLEAVTADSKDKEPGGVGLELLDGVQWDFLDSTSKTIRHVLQQSGIINTEFDILVTRSKNAKTTPNQMQTSILNKLSHESSAITSINSMLSIYAFTCICRIVINLPKPGRVIHKCLNAYKSAINNYADLSKEMKAQFDLVFQEYDDLHSQSMSIWNFDPEAMFSKTFK